MACTILAVCIIWDDVKGIPSVVVSMMDRGALIFGSQFYKTHKLTGLTAKSTGIFGQAAHSDDIGKENNRSDNTDRHKTQTDNVHQDGLLTDNTSQTDKVDKDSIQADNSVIQIDNSVQDSIKTDNGDQDNIQTDNGDKDNIRRDNDSAVKDVTKSTGSFWADFVFPEPDCEGKLLVYECGAGWCGGLGDREKGIMSAFLLALLTGRTLVVDHRKPCDIKKFLKPNLYDWSKCLPHIGTAKLKGNYMVNYIDWKGNLPRSFAGFKSGDIWKDFVVTIHVNVPLLDRVIDHQDTPLRLPWLRTAPKERVFTELMHALFKLELNLEKHLDSFIENQKAGKSCHFVGAHIRSDFLTNVDIQYVFTFLDKFSKQDNVCLYVASDNLQIRDRALKQFAKATSINRPIVHVDHTRYSCDGMYTAVFEQWILSKAETLIMTPSGYSRMAAYIRGSSQNLYLLIMKTAKSDTHFEKIGLNRLTRLYTKS